jgi:hypothetical protein
LQDKKIRACVPRNLGKNLETLFMDNYPSAAKHKGASPVEWLHSMWDPELALPAFLVSISPECSLSKRTVGHPPTSPAAAAVPEEGACMPSPRASNISQLDACLASDDFRRIWHMRLGSSRSSLTGSMSIHEFAGKKDSVGNVFAMMDASESVMRRISSTVASSFTAKLCRVRVTSHKRKRNTGAGSGGNSSDGSGF